MWLFSRFPRGRKKESERARTLTTGQGDKKRGKITTHGMMDLLNSTLLKIRVYNMRQGGLQHCTKLEIRSMEPSHSLSAECVNYLSPRSLSHVSQRARCGHVTTEACNTVNQRNSSANNRGRTPVCKWRRHFGHRLLSLFPPTPVDNY